MTTQIDKTYDETIDRERLEREAYATKVRQNFEKAEAKKVADNEAKKDRLAKILKIDRANVNELLGLLKVIW